MSCKQTLSSLSWAKRFGKSSNSKPIKQISIRQNKTVRSNDTTQSQQIFNKNVQQNDIKKITINDELLFNKNDNHDDHDIDMMDIDCNDDETDDNKNEEKTENEQENEENLEDYSAFLSLPIGERVLLLRIVSIILPHQSGYNLLKCFRIYNKIFGKELCEQSTNNIWFWKSLYHRDFGELQFKQENHRRKRNKISVEQQQKEYKLNKKESKLFWRKHYIKQYSYTFKIHHTINAIWVCRKKNNKNGQLVTSRKKQIVETIEYDSCYAILAKASAFGRVCLALADS